MRSIFGVVLVSACAAGNRGSTIYSPGAPKPDPRTGAEAARGAEATGG